MLRELGLEESGEGGPQRGDPELYPTIRKGGHRIILTRRILDEYIRESTKEGFPAVLIQPVADHLDAQGLVVQPRLPGGRRDFPGIPQAHRVFPVVAIDSQADYLITENPVWLDRADTIAQHGPTVTVTTPGAFVRREGR